MSGSERTIRPDGVALPESAPEVRRRLGLSWWLTSATVVVDQASKALVVAAIPQYSSHTVIPNIVDLVHVQNAGVAFGLMNEFAHPRRPLFTIGLAVIALVSIMVYSRHVRSHERLARVGLSLILGGAVGNLIDRVRQGFVVDFVDVYWRGWHFWAFNAADAAITIGATLVCLDMLFVSRHASNPV